MKLAIYGGSFNPPHLGHAAAIRAVLEAIRPDELRVIPAATPPHKKLAAGSPDVYIFFFSFGCITQLVGS